MQIKEMFRKEIDRELQRHFAAYKKVFWAPRRKWAYGSPASLEAVNLTF